MGEIWLGILGLSHASGCALVCMWNVSVALQKAKKRAALEGCLTLYKQQKYLRPSHPYGSAWLGSVFMYFSLCTVDLISLFDQISAAVCGFNLYQRHSAAGSLLFCPFFYWLLLSLTALISFKVFMRIFIRGILFVKSRWILADFLLLLPHQMLQGFGPTCGGRMASLLFGCYQVRCAAAVVQGFEQVTFAVESRLPAERCWGFTSECGQALLLETSWNLI